MNNAILSQAHRDALRYFITLAIYGYTAANNLGYRRDHGVEADLIDRKLLHTRVTGTWITAYGAATIIGR